MLIAAHVADERVTMAHRSRKTRANAAHQGRALRHPASVEDVNYQIPRFFKLAACDWIAERRFELLLSCATSARIRAADRAVPRPRASGLCSSSLELGPSCKAVQLVERGMSEHGIFLPQW